MTWYNVNKIVQVWSGHADSAQKKGKLYPPAGLESIDEYKGSVQFDPEQVRFDFPGWFDDIPTTQYPQYWARLDDLTFEPWVEGEDQEDPGPVGPDPVPVPEPEPAPEPSDVPSFEEIGRVIVYLKSL